MTGEWIEPLGKILDESGVRFTFSQHCHSGIADMISPDHKCGCRRCLTSRGEIWTDETEAQAERDSKQAQLAWKARTAAWMKENGW